MNVELSQIQGLVLSSYADRPAAVYAVFRIEDGARAKAWLARVLDRIQFADFLSTPRGRDPDLREVVLNLAFTHPGLETIGLPAEALAGFSDAFQEGMHVSARARQLGDDHGSAPENWGWGNYEHHVHGILAAFGGRKPGTQADIDALAELLETELSEANGFRIVRILPALLLPDRPHEHFGFRDGFSNPAIHGTPHASKTHDLLAPGEFLLGYPNGYDQHGLTPRVRAEHDPSKLLPERDDGTRDFGKNGSFLVFRQLEQKVDLFHAFTETKAKELGVSADWVGAKMVGRWKNGMPLTIDPDGSHPDPESPPTKFLFTHEDATGARCPIGSHIRRTNPRDTMLPEPHDQPLSGDPKIPSTRDKRLELTNRRRMLRRGRIYQHGDEKGLFFLCFNGNIRRQFEFVQSMWSLNPNFAGLKDAPDPSLAARSHPYAASRFTVQGSETRPTQTFDGLARFVETRGGAYFFMPGKRALEFLARTVPAEAVVVDDEVADAKAEADLHSQKVADAYEKDEKKPAVRGFHVKAHGIVRAEVTVRDDLPQAFRHGLFAEPRTYRAWARISSSAFGRNPDTEPDVHGFALKVMGVTGDRAEGGFEHQTQDFLMIDSPFLMVGTIAEALRFDRAAIAGNASLLLHLLTHPAEALRVLAMRKKPAHPLEGTFSSVTPYRLGPTKIVRWGLRVASGVELVDVEPGENHLRQALARQLEVDGRIRLELCVEVQGAGKQPLDDGSVDWKGSIERIADVVLLPDGFDTDEQEALGEKMSFNPWNALDAHRPLGNLNRARRIVYSAVYAKRTTLNGGSHFEPEP